MHSSEWITAKSTVGVANSIQWGRELALQEGVKSRFRGALLLHMSAHHTNVPKWETQTFSNRDGNVCCTQKHCTAECDYSMKASTFAAILTGPCGN